MWIYRQLHLLTEGMKKRGTKVSYTEQCSTDMGRVANGQLK